MPVEDICQPQVETALQKVGWIIVRKQVYITEGDISVYIDIEAAKQDAQMFIEVKCFPEQATTTEFYTALGQYQVYRQVLAIQKPNHTLYLAMPDAIYEELSAVYRDTLADNRVKLILVNLEKEIITRWME
jgi:hypothetical protein